MEPPKCMACFKASATLQCRHCNDFFICSRACAEDYGVSQELHKQGICVSSEEPIGVEWAHAHNESPRGLYHRLIKESNHAREMVRKLQGVPGQERNLAYWREVANQKGTEARQVQLYHGMTEAIEAPYVARRSYKTEIIHWTKELANARTPQAIARAQKNLHLAQVKEQEWLKSQGLADSI